MRLRGSAARPQPCGTVVGQARMNSSLSAAASGSARPWAARRRGVSAGA